MLSYRHAFHAGNHADVLKHLVLYCVLNYFNRKDKPYWYIDTHAGAGIYDLRGDKANKVGEYREGVARLISQQLQSELLQGFVNHLQDSLPEKYLYAGSPWWAQSVLRAVDKLRLFELHHADFESLQNCFSDSEFKRRCLIRQEDGFKGLILLLPPLTRRAVVLIDPPYEQKQDYVRVVNTLRDALKRFAQGCYMVWYPCLSREESRMLPEKLMRLLPDNYLHVWLNVGKPRADGFGMFGSGMFILNPPYVLVDELKQVMPELLQLLRQDDFAGFGLDYQIR